MTRPGLLAGIFVGGRGRRMGGVAKGLLRPPSGETSIVARWAALLDAANVAWVVVGGREQYAACGPVIDDDPPETGPIGGLHALVQTARIGSVVALGGDMPFVSAALLGRVLDAPAAPAVAPHHGDRYEPLLARYDAATMLSRLPERISSGDHSLQSLLAAVGGAKMQLSPEEVAQLRDWDTRADVELA